MAGDMRLRLAELRARAPEAGLLLDFDGTLAPIVVDPAEARPLAGSVAALHVLVGRFRLVAVISGRPASFLADQLDVPGLVRVGAYGLERVTGDEVTTSPEAVPWLPVIDEVVAAARRAAPPGAVVEDKGTSVTLHYRAAPEVQAWARAFAASEGEARGLVAHDARRAVELRPPVTVDKGTAAAALIAEAGLVAACAAGDDAGDLAAFAAVSRLPLHVRVAVTSEEAPPALLAAADVVVDGPPGMLAVLRELAA